jgi:hypothetical protein
MLIFGDNKADGGDISYFKEEMATAFKMSDLGILWYYLMR